MDWLGFDLCREPRRLRHAGRRLASHRRLGGDPSRRASPEESPHRGRKRRLPRRREVSGLSSPAPRYVEELPPPHDDAGADRGVGDRRFRRSQGRALRSRVPLLPPGQWLLHGDEGSCLECSRNRGIPRSLRDRSLDRCAPSTGLLVRDGRRAKPRSTALHLDQRRRAMGALSIDLRRPRPLLRPCRWACGIAPASAVTSSAGSRARTKNPGTIPRPKSSASLAGPATAPPPRTPRDTATP